MTFDDDMTLGEARDRLRDALFPDGPDGKPTSEAHECPLCRRNAKVYRRKIHAVMAYALIRCYRAGGGDGYVHMPTVVPEHYQDSDFARVTLWDLAVELAEKREDGGRAGWYRLTPDGVAFVLDRQSVSKYRVTYANRILRREGDFVGIRDALSTRFRYDDLMAGV